MMLSQSYDWNSKRRSDFLLRIFWRYLLKFSRNVNQK